MRFLSKMLVVLLLTGLATGQARLLRHPTYSEGHVAFSYLGDIWSANEDGSMVQRLTVHRGRDVYPRYSPDGKWIAFSSNRYGNYDVFVIPAKGGPARQLTYHSASDIVVGWSHDSKKVIFQSSRGLNYPGIPNLYEVSADGGLETPLPTDWGYWGSYSPDGKMLVFNRHPMVWWRKHYRGSYAADLWTLNVSTKKYTHLGDDDYKGNYFWPMMAGSGDIYFVSDRLDNEAKIRPGSPEVLKSANNIWRMPSGGGKPAQVTHHNSGNVFFPSMSSDGRVIVYEGDFGLWKLDTKSGKATEIKLDIPSDTKENFVEAITIRNDTDGYALSPTGKRAAIVAHGEIFSIATDKGNPQQVTESFWRDDEPSWSPDGKWIAFVSDRSGREEVWIAHEDGTGLKQLSNSDSDKSELEWLPDSKSLLYSGSDHKLYRVDLETGKTQTIASSEVSNVSRVRVSPDGKWVAYVKSDRELRPHVYIASSAGGDEHHIGDDERTFSETAPAWTRDGKSLLFLGGVNQGGSARLQRNQTQVYRVSLTREKRPYNDAGVDSEDEAREMERSTPRGPRGGGMGAGDGEPPRVEVKIDFDTIGRRSHQLTRLSDNIVAVEPSPDGKLIAFVALGELESGGFTSTIYMIQEDGTQQVRVAESAGGGPGEGEGGGGMRALSNLNFTRDGRTLYFMEGENLNSVDISSLATAAASGGRGSAPGAATARNFERKRVTFSVQVEVNHALEWKQVFAESWRVMRNRFYDAKMHGADWAAARATFEPLMDYVADQEEMHNVVSQMIGELNASHTGISATPTAEERERMVQTRFPGFVIESDASGYYKVTKIYKGGPADQDYVKLEIGNFILAIDGHPIKAGDNYWKDLNGLRTQKIEFTVNSTVAMEGAWKTKIAPITAEANSTLQYEDWVAARRALVDKLSNGEIGYLHIRQMNAAALRKFQRDFIEYRNKKALIIDQRFNPGGGIDQELLAILGQKQYQVTRGRDSVEITRPQQGFFGPMVVMQNERSTSDAEVFPDGFRTLGLGKVVGTPTYGAVIGTGAYRLLDGSSIRTPGTGLWSVKGYNLENFGVPPDVLVDNTPDDFLAGRDAQLIKAVEVLQQDMKTTPNKKAVALNQ